MSEGTGLERGEIRMKGKQGVGSGGGGIKESFTVYENFYLASEQRKKVLIKTDMHTHTRRHNAQDNGLGTQLVKASNAHRERERERALDIIHTLDGIAHG